VHTLSKPFEPALFLNVVRELIGPPAAAVPA
jgi:hypothetical protein